MRKILVFLKYPRPGQVKTRLARGLGDQVANEVYRACIELTLQHLKGMRRDVVILVDPPGALEDTRTWLGPNWSLWPQQGLDLGERLDSASRQAFSEGAKQVVIIGTDSPWIKEEHIRRAFEVLGRAAVVLGPTEDGGYYLIGTSRYLPELFENVMWSSPFVYAQTQAKVRALRLIFETLPCGYDVDYLDDVKRFLTEECRGGHASTAIETMDNLIRRRK